jgi:pimeloyl-ACP methyl ester carboxylesterase
MSFTTGFRDGPQFGKATISYPSNATPPLTAVAIVPGFFAVQASIAPWAPFLASHGIVTITIDTNSSSAQPNERALALLDALETVKAEHTRAGSPLQGKLDVSRLAVMGWSMGGGGALIAANATPALRAAISLCGWESKKFAQNQVPSLMFAATSDSLAGGMSQGFYDSIPVSTPKLLFEVQGGSHEIANNPSNLSGQIGRYGLSWLKVFLEDDARYRKFLKEQPTGTATFKSTLN